MDQCRIQEKIIRTILYDIFTTKEYNKYVFPRLNSTEPLYIDVSLHFMRIEEIDEKNEKMISTGYLEISWQDPGLRWDSEYYGNIQQVYIQQNEMWIPDIFLVNRAGQFSGFGGSFYYIKVDENGSAVWMPFDVFESRCSLHTDYFPFDKQKCELIFSIWSHSVADVKIRNSRNGIVFDQTFAENGGWNIVSTSCILNETFSDSSVIFTFHIQRKSLYFVMIIICPIVFLGFLSGFVFLIPAESGEKMGYSVTVFLSQIVFLSIIESYIPINSDRVSVLQMYLLIQIIVGVLIIVISSAEVHIQNRNGDIPVNGVFRKLATLKEACLCRKRDIQTESEDSECRDQLNLKTQDIKEISWQDVSTIVDFYCFWSFIILYTLINAITIIVTGKLLS